jgi:cation diffusion facilitator CzcD-associated flavoprotein CzcO
METYDVVIVGAGLSGINCAYRLQTETPGTSFTVLEGREGIGGTWDLFKFPGVRSDSDLPSLGFAWYPWPYEQVFAEGPLILEYMKDAASKHNIGKHIQFQQKVVSANWSSKTHKWELVVASQGQTRHIKAGFLALGTGYYDYETPLQTTIPGLDKFKGKTIHPQFWPEQYDYSGQKLAIIGSGATAITLLPRLAQQAADVTMIQRSPAYIGSLPDATPLSSWARKLFPLSWVAIWERFYHTAFFYWIALFYRTFPQAARSVLLKEMAAALPEDVKAKPHFEPSYMPGTQRVCLAPNSDFFKALFRKNAHVVTGEIDTVAEHHIRMKDGTSVEADVIITATGLSMKFGGGVDLRVDGESISWGKRMVWNAAMLDGVPNLVWMLGYTDGAWTIGADAAALILVRVLKYMRRTQAASVTPRAPRDAAVEMRRLWPLDSTYRQIADQCLPVYGAKGPWAPRRLSPFADYLHSRWGNVTDGLEFRAMNS